MLTFAGLLGIVDYKVILPTILLVNTYILYNHLRDKSTLDNIQEHFKRSQQNRSKVQFSDPPDELTRELFMRSKEIRLSGVSLFRFLPMNYLQIEKSLSEGAAVKIIVMNPESDAASLLEYRSPSNTPVSVQKSRIADTINFVMRWKEKLPTANIKIKTIDYLSPYSLTLLTPSDSKKHDFCYIRLFPFKAPSLCAPAMVFTSEVDEELFHYFYDQFEKMWDAGTEIKQSIDESNI